MKSGYKIAMQVNHLKHAHVHAQYQQKAER